MSFKTIALSSLSLVSLSLCHPSLSLGVALLKKKKMKKCKSDYKKNISGLGVFSSARTPGAVCDFFFFSYDGILLLVFESTSQASEAFFQTKPKETKRRSAEPEPEQQQ